MAPEVVMCLLGRRWRLEAVHVDTLGVEAAHHVLDRAVLTGRVDRLKDDQQRAVGLGKKRSCKSSKAAFASACAAAPWSFRSCSSWRPGSKSLANPTLDPGFTRVASASRFQSADNFASWLCHQSIGRGARCVQGNDLSRPSSMRVRSSPPTVRRMLPLPCAVRQVVIAAFALVSKGRVLSRSASAAGRGHTRAG